MLSMLGNRDEMERTRRHVLKKYPVLPADAQELLFAMTMLLESIVWPARRSAMLILPGAAHAAQPQPAG